MKISVIIPIYNVEKYIRECLESVVNQTYKNLEIIVVNDGTKDNSMKIVEEYLSDKRIKIINKENGGLSSARNRGMEEATGDYISFIDSDDYIAIDMYEKLVKEINNEDIIIFDYTIFNDRTKEVVNYVKEFSIKVPFTHDEEYLYAAFLCTCWSKLYKRLYLENNKYKFYNSLYEDEYWNLETILLAKNIKYIDQKFYYYRVNRENSIIQKTREKIDHNFYKKQQISYEKILNKIENFIKENREILPSGKILYSILKREEFRAYIYNKINLKEFKENFKVDELSKLEKKFFSKKIKELLKNKNIKKIEEFSFRDLFYWKNELIDWSCIRRRIKLYLKIKKGK